MQTMFADKTAMIKAYTILLIYYTIYPSDKIPYNFK